MSAKASTMMICPHARLGQLPARELDVIRRFLFQHIQPVDEPSAAAWRGLWRSLFNAEPGEGVQLQHAAGRSGPYHRRHRVILQRLYASQDAYDHIDRLHDFLKVGGGFVTWQGDEGELVPVPRSTAYPKCSDAEMRVAHDAMVAFLRTEQAQSCLWPHLTPQCRQEAVEAILRDPQPDQEGA